MEGITAILVVGILFIGLPWVILHYMTKWKQAPKITNEDEQLLDDMHNLARRLEARVETVERIIAADNPDFRRVAGRDDDYRPNLTKDRGYDRLQGSN